MVKAAKKTLALTGTLVNGKSTSIKEILWRTAHSELIAQGFSRDTGMVAWAGRYGVLKRVTRISAVDDGRHVRHKRTELQPTEEPGIAPQMTATYLLHRSAFMELGDIGLPLVELKEIPIFLQLDDEHAEEYKRFHEKLYDECRQRSIKGGHAFAKFIPATLNYADRPDLGGKVEFISKDPRIPPLVIDAPVFPADYYHAKERELVRIVQENLNEDRGVIIYASYTDSYGVDERLRQVLAAHGIEAEVLKSSVSQDKRVEWLAQAADRKVIICNMRLVEVGLDLLPWPSIVFYQLNYDVNIVRQSSRRSWRIGQNRECRIYYLVYDGTQQLSQFKNVMAKRGHAMMVEGRLDRSELAQYARDFHTALAADIANCLAAAGLADAWSSLARKDIDPGLRLVSEAEFEAEIKKARKRLVAETLRLCGVARADTDKVVSWDELYEKFVKNAPKKKKRTKRYDETVAQITLLDVIGGSW
jgi:hypothetical protein